jgi:hypothetical protein
MFSVETLDEFVLEERHTASMVETLDEEVHLEKRREAMNAREPNSEAQLCKNIEAFQYTGTSSSDTNPPTHNSHE